MRLIVRCPKCLRQYDVAGRPVGERMLCACGTALEVRQPRGHDAAVVRCSACGGPRTGDDRSCAHCGARLTIHERDLHTVCPGCLARISDRASFCHACGLRIVAEDSGSAPTEWPCPACGDEAKLHSRRFDDAVGGAECTLCGGLFIEHAVFDHLERRARAAEPTAADGDPPTAPAPASRLSASPSDRMSDQAGPLYRPCPVCRKLMNRQNYARRSGVIVDRCREHGVWFDDDELARVLQFVGQGGARRAAARDAEETRHTERIRRLGGSKVDPEVAFGRLGESEGGFFDVVDALTSFLFPRR